MSALQAGWEAGVAAYRGNGAASSRQSQDELAKEYALRWAYYDNDRATVYGTARRAALNTAGVRLYTHTRFIVNPVRPVVSFYKDHLFPSEPETLEGGGSLATPMAEGAEEGLRAAVAQIDQWTNWLAEGLRAVEMWAALGEVLIEVKDELEREKVTHEIIKPEYVAWVEVDAANNVKAYALEYKVRDPNTKDHYRFRKVVDDEAFRFFRDDKPFDPPTRPKGDNTRRSQGVYVNPYGFVPAVWAKHIDRGTHGDPAFWNYEKVDEANSALSHAHDHIHKAIEAGKFIGGAKVVEPLTGAFKDPRTGLIVPYDTRTDWVVMISPEAAQVSDLGSSFDLLQADPYVTRILEGFVADYAELQAAKLIEEHGATSGEALKFKLGRAQSRLDQGAANINPQIVKLKQMSVAIAGWRANGGGWTRSDAQREVFKEFGLDSYGKGKLNFGLRRPLLVQSTPMEEEELKAKKAERANAIAAKVDDLEYLKVSGYSEEEATAILDRRGEVKTPPEGEE